LLYYVIRYRKEIVFKNLNLVFKNKSEQERIKIAKKFYKHFSDLILESIKNYSITSYQSQERMKCINPELLDNYFNEKKTIFIMGGHYNNWELYALSAAKQTKYKLHAIYTPVQNKFINTKTKKSREKYGLKMLNKKKVKDFINNIGPNSQKAIVFGFDQSPRKNQHMYWLNFLGQKTAVQFGSEKYAKQLNVPIFFGEIQKVKRGYYTLKYHLITEDPSKLKKGEIIKKANALLEKIIFNKPEFWLWSHNRWKLTNYE